jgi:ribonuclease-3
VWIIPNIRRSRSDKRLASAIKALCGLTPSNLSVYKLALLHSSRAKPAFNGFRESNERLEYLGDAVLGAAIADYLFKKYPFKSEGFLTEIRSRIVNRDSLNQLGRKLGVQALMEFDTHNRQLQSSILGNTLEAIVGAVYLDKGFVRCKNFVINKLLVPHHDLEMLVSSDSNYKSRIIEWAQRQGKEVRFEVVSVRRARGQKEFEAQVIVNGEPMGKGYGLNKKKAEQDAAAKACEQVGTADHGPLTD